MFSKKKAGAFQNHVKSSLTAYVGGVQPGGHMWPLECRNSPCKAQDKWKLALGAK